MQEIIKKARELDINIYSGKINDMKKDLIRSIQIAEGNFPCYADKDAQCEQPDCIWRIDCPSNSLPF